MRYILLLIIPMILFTSCSNLRKNKSTSKSSTKITQEIATVKTTGTKLDSSGKTTASSTQVKSEATSETTSVKIEFRDSLNADSVVFNWDEWIKAVETEMPTKTDSAVNNRGKPANRLNKISVPSKAIKSITITGTRQVFKTDSLAKSQVDDVRKVQQDTGTQVTTAKTTVDHKEKQKEKTVERKQRLLAGIGLVTCIVAIILILLYLKRKKKNIKSITE